MRYALTGHWGGNFYRNPLFFTHRVRLFNNTGQRFEYVIIKKIIKETYPI